MGVHLQAWDVYAPEALKKARSSAPFKRIEESWQEKRAYIQEAVRALPGGLRGPARAALRRLKPFRPDRAGCTRMADPGAVLEWPQFTVALDPATGALRQLRERRNGRSWASPGHPLALFAYQAFSQGDYDRYLKQYLTARPEWALHCLGRPGLEKLAVASRTWLPRLRSAWHREDAGGDSLLVELEMPGVAGKGVSGAPALVTLEYVVSRKEPEVGITLQWFGKRATRLPEAVWLSFMPPVRRGGAWEMDKMGQTVDPREVVKNGGRKLHAVGSGIRYSDPRGTLAIESLDACLVAPGERTLLRFDNARPAVGRGMHFCLCNNVWGTNFTMWFGEDMRFRFRLRSEAGSGSARP